MNSGGGRQNQSFNEFLQDDQIAFAAILESREMHLRAQIDHLEKRMTLLEAQLAAVNGAACSKEQSVNGAVSAICERLEQIERRLFWRYVNRQ